MPYYNNDPGPEIAQASGGVFNPYTGRLNGAALVMNFLNQIEAGKRKKKEEAWELEDRDLNKRYKEASIRNLDEVKPTPEPKPVSKVSPLMVKSLMKRLDYPEESIQEVDTMNDPALSSTWGKLQDHIKTLQTQGLKIPKTAPTQKGKLQQAQLRSALGVIKDRGTRYNSALSQLYANPDKGMLASGQIAEYEGILDELERQSGEVAAMMNSLDENGELSEEQLRDLFLILKWKRRYRTIPKGPTDAPKSKAELEAEKSGITLDPIK